MKVCMGVQLAGVCVCWVVQLGLHTTCQPRDGWLKSGDERATSASPSCCCPIQAVLRPLAPVHLPPLAAADKVPNASPTAASASSDMYGAAAADACRQLNERLAPYYAKMPGKSFKVGRGLVGGGGRRVPSSRTCHLPRVALGSLPAVSIAGPASKP